MALILNEVKKAEEIIFTGELGNKPSATLFMLAKYYRKYCNYNQKDTIIALNEFMNKNYKNYNSVLWENIIESISKNSLKYELRKIDNIGITKNELDIIKKLNNINHEKLVFSMLCYAKAHNETNKNNNNWVNCTIPELFKVSRVSLKYKNDKMYMLNDIKNNLLIDEKDDNGNLIKQSLISFSKKNDNKNIRLNFVDEKNEDIVLLINDFRELGYEYLLYLGENYSKCETCGILFKQNKNNTYKYCNKHRGYQAIETKKITCIDCNKEFEVDSLSRRIRCDDCEKIERQRINKEYYNKHKN